jgi:hypothetical protein
MKMEHVRRKQRISERLQHLLANWIPTERERTRELSSAVTWIRPVDVYDP